ncbi:MAG: ATP phosphoribosyltransferase [Dehalococcoidia bacterium]
MPLKLALPAGQLARPTDELLRRAGLIVRGYSDGSRAYRLRLEGHEGVVLRVFREKDIPIQIALGNYDLGVCSLAWLKELLVRFPSEAVVQLRALPLGSSGLYVAAAADSGVGSLDDLAGVPGLRLVSEYPGLAEAFALSARLPAYRVFSVWGAAEAYPPEDADLAVVAASSEEEVRGQGLWPLYRLLVGSPWLIAHRRSLEAKDLSPLLGPLMTLDGGREPEAGLALPSALAGASRPALASERAAATVRLALPDGHLQASVVDSLRKAGLSCEGYDERGWVRRPGSALEGVELKVIRPHDMPQQVALGNFDLAIGGRDCLMEHLLQFPGSPVDEAVDLGGGQFDLSAVVSEGLPAASLAEAVELWRSQGLKAIRVASEFPAIADHYARENHFWRYQVIPIGGASEGFVPEDAELLIEGVQTGRTLAENRLKAIDRFLRSTTCLIASKREPPPARAKLLSQLIERFRRVASSQAAAG